MPRTQDYNPFDPYAEDPLARQRRAGMSPSYVPQPIAGVGTTDTGIPDAPYVPYEEGGFTGGKLPGDVNATAPTAAAPSYTPQAIGGWDQTKWSDPTHNTIKYQAGRILSQFDPNAIRANPEPLLAAFRAAGLNPTWMGDDTVDFNDGYGPIDVITSQGQWAWQPDAQQGTGAGTGASSIMSTLTSQALAGGAGTGTGGGAFGDQIRQMVLNLMGQSPTDVSTNPTYRGAIDAYGVQQQRATENERNTIAEQAAAEGTLNTGGFRDRILGAEQTQGENTASFAGNLAVRELERQRDEIMQALNIGAGLMTEEQRIALSERLGLINANINQQQVSNQNTQFNQNLGWEQAMWEYGANQGWWS